MPQKTGFLGLKLTPAKVCVSVEEPDAPAAAPAEPVVEKKTPVQEAVKAAPVAEEPAAAAAQPAQYCLTVAAALSLYTLYTASWQAKRAQPSFPLSQ